MDEEHTGEEAKEDLLHQGRDLASTPAFVVDVEREDGHGGGKGDDGYGDAVVQACQRKGGLIGWLACCRSLHN